MLEIPNSAGLGVMDTENPQVPGKGPGGGKTLGGGEGGGGGKDYIRRTQRCQKKRSEWLKQRPPKFTRPNIRNNNNAGKRLPLNKSQDMRD